MERFLSLEQTDSALQGVIYILGARADGAFSSALKETFPGVVFFPDTPPPSVQNPHLAIAICDRCDDRSQREFHAWAGRAAVPALRVELRGEAALIGPVSLPDRAGCGYCAYARLTAASANYEACSEDRSPPQLAKSVVRILRKEVDAIARDGPEQSELLDHVLIVDSDSQEPSLHRFIPLPRCLVCGGSASFRSGIQTRESIRLSSEDSPEIVLAALDGWVDQRIGVISNLVVEPAADLDVSLPITVVAGPVHLMEADSTLHRLPLGWGKGLTVSGAVLSAVG